jgi:transposase
MRDLGVKVVKIDEHRTSKCCSSCRSGEVHNVTYDGKQCHQVVRCGNSELCGVVWQRDLNASRNIRELLMCKVRGDERPDKRIKSPLEKWSMPRVVSAVRRDFCP